MSRASLAELQGWLIERVLEPAAAFASAPAVEERIVAGGLPARERLGIYRHGYVARLVECLEDDYPALQHALGTEPFAQLCRDFIRQHPPRSASLNYYGAPFAGYCGGRSERWARFAAELAELEWAVVEAVHEHEGERLELASLVPLSAEDWARARLLPSPTLRLLQTQHAVGSYYQSWREGDALTERFPAPERSALAVCRRGGDVWRVRIELELVPLLTRLIDGTPLLAALEAAAAPGENGAPPPSLAALQQAFRDWVSCGMFSGVDTAPS